MSEARVTVAIDTEEDNWGSYAPTGATTGNILHLTELHELMAARGAKPTYLVNRPPLVDAEATRVLGALAERPETEIGAHCHPWNTPPYDDSAPRSSMMCDLPHELNREKIAEVTRLLGTELGARPTSFRAGRWGFGPTVSRALHDNGYLVDVSVSPFIDWAMDGGPDYTNAPHRPYRFAPERPFEPDPDGPMVEIPTTVGFLQGRHAENGARYHWIRRSPLGRLKVIAILERLGRLNRRWLSPETSNGEDMVRLVEACIESGEPVLGLTFHSCTLLPGVTPFVRDDSDRKRFLESIDRVLAFCSEAGLTFSTLSELGTALGTGPRAEGSQPDSPRRSRPGASSPGPSADTAPDSEPSSRAR